MNINSRNALIVSAIAIFCVSAYAGKPAPPPPPPATVTTVHDLDTSGSPLLFRGDDFNQNSQATYTNTGGVTTGAGVGWSLTLYNQVSRTVCLTFSPVTGSPVAPNGCYSDKVEIYSHCFDDHGTEIQIQTIAVGMSQSNCAFSFDFENGRSKYKMAMGQPGLPTGGVTGLATVTCNASNGTVCNSWTIVPNLGTPNATIANLYFYGSHGLAYTGQQYYLTFRVDAVNP
jgi:hypothetical protein